MRVFNLQTFYWSDCPICISCSSAGKETFLLFNNIWILFPLGRLSSCESTQGKLFYRKALQTEGYWSVTACRGISWDRPSAVWQLLPFKSGNFRDKCPVTNDAQFYNKFYCFYCHLFLSVTTILDCFSGKIKT